VLIGKPGVDSRLSGAGDLGDFIDACALEATLEKHLSRRIEDSLLDLAGMSARRPPTSNSPARPLGHGAGFHRRFHLHRASFAKTAIAKIRAHAP
jgi:hypothetical protein